VRECGEIAGVVRVARAGATPDGGPSSGRNPATPGAADWLVLDFFLGTIWHADTGDVVESVQALIDQGNADPVTIREISWSLWDIMSAIM
jgi:hypothetical protein